MITKWEEDDDLNDADGGSDIGNSATGSGSAECNTEESAGGSECHGA